jgi:tRNA threonylcarbamoyladenosine modification (KEOPS) complex  Pcc1 subunit
MRTPPKKVLKPNIEQLVISDLKKNGKTLMLVLDRDTQAALKAKDKSELIAAINCNLRTIAAVNEVLLYYGDAGIFEEGLN